MILPMIAHFSRLSLQSGPLVQNTFPVLQILQRDRCKTPVAHRADGLCQGVCAGERRHVADAVAHGRAAQMVAIAARLLAKGDVHEQAGSRRWRSCRLC